jgi:glycine/D-amino acid oxidase-like deaminating enzyme
VKADVLVLACNAYLDELDPQLSSCILPVGTYQVATAPLTPEQATALLPSNVCVTDNQFVLDYFRRTPDNRLLFGGGCTYLGGMPKDIAAATRPFLERVFPQLKGVELQFAWGGHIDLTMNRTPDVGGEGNRYWLQGYSGTACCRHWPPPARCPMQFSARRMNWRCIRA